jgi:hypothetical protein
VDAGVWCALDCKIVDAVVVVVMVTVVRCWRCHCNKRPRHASGIFACSTQKIRGSRGGAAACNDGTHDLHSQRANARAQSTYRESFSLRASMNLEPFFLASVLLGSCGSVVRGCCCCAAEVPLLLLSAAAASAYAFVSFAQVEGRPTTMTERRQKTTM